MPQKMKLDTTVRVRLSRDQRTVLTVIAAQVGLDLSSWIRTVALQAARDNTHRKDGYRPTRAVRLAALRVESESP